MLRPLGICNNRTVNAKMRMVTVLLRSLFCLVGGLLVFYLGWWLISRLSVAAGLHIMGRQACVLQIFRFYKLGLFSMVINMRQQPITLFSMKV